MGSVLLMIENELQVKGFNQKTFAESIGVKPATVSKVFKGISELGFLYMSKTSRLLCDGKDSILRAACVSYYEKPENVKLSLEYLSTNRYLDDLKSVLDNCHFNAKDEQWRTAYQMVYDFQSREISNEDLLFNIRDAFNEIKDPFLKALLHIIEGNIYIRTKEYNRLFMMAEKSKELVNDLCDCSMKRSLQARVNEQFARGYLFEKCDTEKAREYANLVISSKIGAKFKADGYYIIGTSFLFENVGQAITNLQESVRIYRESGRDNIATMMERNIEFARTVGGYTEDRDTVDMDESEKAFLHAKKGEGKEALRLLENLAETPFRLYYKGVATGNGIHHFEALKKLMDSGNKFYASLPYQELLKSEEYKEIAKVLYKK